MERPSNRGEKAVRKRFAGATTEAARRLSARVLDNVCGPCRDRSGSDCRAAHSDPCVNWSCCFRKSESV